VRYYVGVDWADQTHAVWVVDERGTKITARTVPHTAAGFSEWGRELDEWRAQGIERWAAIERPEGRVVDFLLDHGVVVYPVNPKEPDELGGELGVPIGIPVRVPLLDGEIAALDPPLLLQRLQKRVEGFRSGLRGQPPNPDGRCLLRSRHARRGEGPGSQQGNESPPVDHQITGSSGRRGRREIAGW